MKKKKRPKRRPREEHISIRMAFQMAEAEPLKSYHIFSLSLLNTVTVHGWCLEPNANISIRTRLK